MTSPASPRVLIYLMRRDLRVADNSIFSEVSKQLKRSRQSFTHFLPVYIFPAQQVELSGFLSPVTAQNPYPEARSSSGGFWRCGPHRARFLAESVWDVKKGLEGIGSGLELRAGMLGDVVQELLVGFKQSEAAVVGIWMTSDEGVEEKRDEREVRQTAEKEGVAFKLWVDEKYYIDEYVWPFHELKRPGYLTQYQS